MEDQVEEGDTVQVWGFLCQVKEMVMFRVLMLWTVYLFGKLCKEVCVCHPKQICFSFHNRGSGLDAGERYLQILGFDMNHAACFLCSFVSWLMDGLHIEY